MQHINTSIKYIIRKHQKGEENINYLNDFKVLIKSKTVFKTLLSFLRLSSGGPNVFLFIIRAVNFSYNFIKYFFYI